MTDLVTVDIDTLIEIINRFDNSDEFDDLEYCVNDVMPATRGNAKLTTIVANMVRQWRQADEKLPDTEQ